MLILDHMQYPVLFYTGFRFSFGLSLKQTKQNILFLRKPKTKLLVQQIFHKRESTILGHTVAAIESNDKILNINKNKVCRFLYYICGIKLVP